jgi:S-(hydroxymethyl)glutathione dehydrogenase/alcohol dehydrogenase
LGKSLNAGKVTTFNECSIVSENRITKIPKDLDMRVATLFGCAVTTAFGVVNNDAKVKIGQSVVVFGLGGLGMNVVQAASMVSADPIVGVDLFEEKFEVAKKFGLTHSLNSEIKNRNKKIKQIVGESGADVVIETTGNSRLIEEAYELTSEKGKTILVGVPNKGDNISIYSLPLHFKKILKGSHGGDALPDIDIPRYIRLIETGKMSLDGLITHDYDLVDINSALDLFKTGKAGRIVINL